MSIYGRPKGLMDFLEVDQPATRGAAEKAHSRIDEAQDWSHLRKARPADQLLPLGTKLIRNLPDDVRPRALASRYPRIVNMLASHWNDRSSCAVYFNDLFSDRRGGRQGFPQDVKSDLEKLRDYWYTRALTLEG